MACLASASGEVLGCYALTEPGAGSDPGGLATTAERDGDSWVITGSKIFITLGTWAGLALVFARTGEEITCFLVPTDSPGFSAHQIKGKLGLRAQDTGELTLDGVRVPAENVLGEEGGGHEGGAVGARQRPDLARGRLRRDRPGLPRGLPRLRDGTAASSAARSRRSSSCRSCWPRSPSRQTRPACSPGRPLSPPTPGPAHARVVDREVLRERGRRPRPRTPPSRCTAATATLTSSRSGSTSGTRALRPSTRERARSRN